MVRTARTLSTALCMALISAGVAAASGGQGGGGGAAGGGGGAGALPPPRLDGIWNGQIVIPAPVELETFSMTLTQDSAGNLQGTMCLQIPAGCGPIISGKVLSDGSISMRFENLLLTGSVIGTKACADGSTANWIAGGVQYRGAFGTWALTQCPAA
jgi:hypothetical protein